MSSTAPTIAGSGAAEFRAGWPIILAGLVGIGVGLTGLPFYTFGTFIKPLSAAFHWSRAEIAFGSFLLHAGTAVTSPFLGRFIDRFGARPAALASMAGLAVGFAAVAMSGPSLISYYLAWSVLALLGCATTPLAWTRLVSLQFNRSRGLALGCAMAGTGVASLLGPRLCSALIQHAGWRAAYGCLAVIVLVVALPLAALASRKRAIPAEAAAVDHVGLTLKQAAATRAFWLLACAFLLISMAQASCVVHLAPLLSDRGLSPAKAAGMASLMGFAVIAGRLIAGRLVDRWHAPYVAAAFLSAPALGLILLALVPGTGLALISIILFGLSGGAEVDTLSYLTGRYFGLKHYGAVYGVTLTVFAIGAATGPILAGAAYDAAGSYGPALWAGAALFVIGSSLLLFLGPYLPGAQAR